MLQSLITFLAPAAAHTQATADPGLATARQPKTRWVQGIYSWRDAFSVLGDAVGFVTLFAGCWLVLWLIQALLPS